MGAIREEDIKAKTLEVKMAMAALGSQLEDGQNVGVVHWVMWNELACAHRPLRHHPRYGGSKLPLPKSALKLVIEWVEEVQALHEIRSIISLMHDADLQCYQSLDLEANNLIGFYEKRGFEVAHIPWEDPHHKKTDHIEKRKMLVEIREQAWEAYIKLPKPVLVQCSAGIDRSSPVAAYISLKRDYETIPRTIRP